MYAVRMKRLKTFFFFLQKSLEKLWGKRKNIVPLHANWFSKTDDFFAKSIAKVFQNG